ncbi:Type VI secretion system (T6SS), amidase effector protein 4 [Desulfomicrobium apsheronum]|uniref:Type VI secretion system (T6SS), amidase effector protein 4 n=1 Tax=Desulfomicrobium apsheronum TaxID=52560 RepID=A0A1I3ZDQ0_9BACT|nr:type VI secretion system amidase effector protein Tae4 [Desulfomicrobium apsheronum]SFK42112.1 Type VI secretion system (T6SS), amidase effector protein 4 [Desulfomicrobium apsheronum]
MPNESLQVKTSSISGSKKTLEKKVICFEQLWDAYPDDVIIHKAEHGSDIFDNHCAIHLSHALYLNGILLKGYKGTRCWGCPQANGQGGIHAIRAQELADYLETQPFAGCPKAIRLSGDTFQENIRGKKGIIFFKDYWRRDGEKNYTGDHIDLWKGNISTLASNGWFKTWLRLHLSGLYEDYFGVSDLKRSSSVLFWEIHSCENNN